MGSVTVGVDMATDPVRTAAVVVGWSTGGAEVREIVHPCSDDDVVRLAARGPVGIDCALGWPTPFVDFLDRVRAGTDPVVPDAAGPAWRERLSMRTTDLHVHRVTGRRPLSVATDRLGLVAIRTASILARLRSAGHDVTRDGTGRTIEVYPAAALRLWGIASAGYKREPAVRERIVRELADEMPWLDWSGAAGNVAATDHVLDAFIAALITRAALIGRAGTPRPEQRGVAAEEGWIVLPECRPGDLLG